MVVAEDDRKQADIVRRYLEREGHEVTVVHDGRAALDAVRGIPRDLLVLDVMMPKVDGLDVTRILRGESDLPVLMLTARSTEDDLLLGLDLGADDYLTKPYSPRELMARVRTLLRRAGKADNAAGVHRVGALVVDPMRHLVQLDGAAVELTRGEFQILEKLAATPERVFTRAQLLTHLHGTDEFITERTVDAHVKNLRRKLEGDPRRPAYLVTVFGVGYKLVDGSGA
ncbi:DNA-binding response regulator [Amycolatopsis keratiniphila subsp. nogabecina]|nr:DNA-binding response regulator [Amycolatopsis keratiniphila subsp. nogabecina]